MTVVLFTGLQVGQILLALLRFEPDSPVKDAHNGYWSVKGGDGSSQRNKFIGLDKLNKTGVCPIWKLY